MGESVVMALQIAVCLVLSAVFSGSETALTSLTRANTRQLLDAGGNRALRLWADRPLEVLVTILIWNNIVNVTASAIATRLAEAALGSIGVALPWLNPIAVAVGVMTLLLLTFGEITPKAIAKSQARVVAPWAMRTLQPFYFVSWPVMRVFLEVTRFVHRITGTEPDEDSPIREEDIEFLVRLGRREGTLTGERERLLRSVFEFTDTVTRDVMVPRPDVTFVSCEATHDDLLDVVVRRGHSRMPVYETTVDNVVGIVHARDLLVWQKERAGNEVFNLRKLMRPAKFAPDTKPISELFAELQTARTHLAIIVDEFGGVCGIVTLEDIFEQFFGDIQDEFDHEEEWVTTEADGTLTVDARMHITDFGDIMGLELDDDDEYDTLGGFVVKQTGDIARVGTIVTQWGLRFTVVAAEKRRIRKVHVERLPDGQEAVESVQRPVEEVEETTALESDVSPEEDNSESAATPPRLTPPPATAVIGPELPPSN